MNVALILACFLASAGITFTRGAGAAFALIYLPALLLFSPVRKLYLPGVPDTNPAVAAIYGILLAGLIAGRRLRLRLTTVDCVVALLFCAYAISAATTAHAYRAVSVVGAMGMKFGFIPYFIVRVAFWKRPPPRQALTLLVATTAIISAFALVESRLWPETYQVVLHRLGLMDAPLHLDVMRRFTFMRAMVSFGHPIDLGIGAALVFALIAMFAIRLRVALSEPWVLGALALALVASFCGISFSAFLGLTCALLLYFGLTTFPRARRGLRTAVALVIVAGFSISSYLAETPIDEASRNESAVYDSFQNRQQLLRNSWAVAKRAGFFGLGDNLPKETVRGRAFRSVDNAYLLITMKRGWVALGLWLILPIGLAGLASRGVRRSHSRRQIRFILAGFSAVIGTMIAMYTVWFGFLYPSLFMIVLALTVNESQAALASPRHSRRQGEAAKRTGSPTETPNPRGRPSGLEGQTAQPRPVSELLRPAHQEAARSRTAKGRSSTR